MKRLLAGALLGCVLLAADGANAAPRGDNVEIEAVTPESREARRVQLEQEMAAWLPRLVGRFKYEGVADLRSEAERLAPPDTTRPMRVKSATGKGDCVAIGNGPGVQCVMHVLWDEEWGPSGEPVEGGVSFLGPAATLYGFDPIAAEVRYLMLNTSGVAESEVGILRGDRTNWTFETHCESDPSARCRRMIRIAAPLDGKFVQLSIDLEQQIRGSWTLVAAFTFDMRRVPQDQVDEES